MNSAKFFQSRHRNFAIEKGQKTIINAHGRLGLVL